MEYCFRLLESELEMDLVSPNLDLEKDTSKGVTKLWHDQYVESETF